MAEWRPEDVFDVSDGSLYSYYSGDGCALTPSNARDLAQYLERWATEQGQATT